MRKIVNHGQSKRYHHARLGLNARLDTLQAALLLAKLDDYLGPEKTHSTGSSPAPEAASQASSSPVPEAAKPTGPLPGQETTEHAAITPNPSAPGHTAPPIPPAPDNDTLPPGPAQRNQVAAAYTEALSPLAAQGLLHLPTPIPNPKWWRRLQPARHDQAKSSSCAPTPDTPPRQGRNVGSSESLVLSVPPRQGWDPCCESSGSQRDETLPDSPASLSAWSQYSIQFLTGPAPATRDAAADFLKNHGIPTAVHYPVPLHQQPVFESLGYQQGAFPVAESVSQRILSLPFDALKTKEEIHQVTQSLTAFFHTNISED
ncbi:MAG: DegT/DnrJ/EryC1/StrS family aminotransferase [Acidobacteria bacterium]|nr:DegT/DnrJ/EryC1/StrS family aminotransferase [Acidobacteriota bacterium]